MSIHDLKKTSGDLTIFINPQTIFGLMNNVEYRNLTMSGDKNVQILLSKR